ncbi:hypothetical protein ACN4EG_21120 [Alkalinema pantanalense CENA528]|uniref:hypothetical protein n=1 Tax=Alkalinema pantanalense TaxID=1620705 RepID=UPI003D6E8C6D
MRVGLFLRIMIAAGLTVGCSRKTQIDSTSAIAATPTPTPTVSSAFTVPSGSKTLTVTVRLSSTDELKVREGDWVTVGQVLADRVRDRVRLEAQHQQLKLQMAKVSQELIPPPPPRPTPELPDLPSPTFLEQIADIEAAELKAKEAQSKLDRQRRKLDLVQFLPPNEVPYQTIPHETEQLKQRQRELDQALAAVDLTRAKLSAAQSSRRYQEYEHGLRIANQQTQLRQQELERARQAQEFDQRKRNQDFQIAQLQAQLQTLETQLEDVKQVRSPYSGKVRKIKFTGQNDRNLSADIVLSISGNVGPVAGNANRDRAGGDGDRSGGDFSSTGPNGR